MALSLPEQKLSSSAGRTHIELVHHDAWADSRHALMTLSEDIPIIP